MKYYQDEEIMRLEWLVMGWLHLFFHLSLSLLCLSLFFKIW